MKTLLNGERTQERTLFVLLFVVFIACFYYFTGIWDFMLTGYLPPFGRDLAQGTFVQNGEFGRILAAIVGVILILFAIAFSLNHQRFLKFYERYSILVGGGLLGGVFLVFVYVVITNWLFELDDKWVYYRTSLNVLRTGLPYWNPEDNLNINSSFLWPYLSSIGHLLGNWGLYVKSFGLASTLLIAILIWRTVANPTLRLVGVAGVLLYYPLVLWSIGGMETAVATLYLSIVAYLYVTLSPRNIIPWFLLGFVIYIRPDVILVGVGAFAIYFLFASVSWRYKIVNGLVFSFPILLFVGMNLLFFQRPLPSPFYVKGWNKAFSGHYPLYVDIQTGLVHFVSAISVSLIIFVTLGLFCLMLIKDRNLYKSQYVGWGIGVLVHTVYMVIGGYQHMNFSFRYWLPSLIPMFYVALLLMQTEGYRVFGKQVWKRNIIYLLNIIVLIQIPVTVLVAFHGRNHEVSLTRAPLRDTFSVATYAQYMEEWLEAGPFLASIVEPGDTVFLYQDLAGAAIADTYTLDQFYMPMSTSSNEEFRTCPGEGRYCFGEFTYILAFAGADFAKFFPTHSVIKKYSTLWILRRNDEIVATDNTKALYIPTTLDEIVTSQASNPKVSDEVSAILSTGVVNTVLGEEATLKVGDTVLLGASKKMIQILPDGTIAPVVGQEGQEIWVSGVGEWNAQSQVYLGLPARFQDGHWVVDTEHLTPNFNINPNNAFIGVFQVSTGVGNYDVKQLLDDQGQPYLRVIAAQSSPFLAVGVQGEPLASLDGVPVAIRAQVRAHTNKTYPVLVMNDVLAAGGQVEEYRTPAQQSDEWVTLIVNIPEIRYPAPEDNFSIGLYDEIETGDWLDIRELSIFIGHLP